MFHFIEEEEDEEIHGPGTTPQPIRPDWLVDKGDDDYPKFTIKDADPDAPDLPASTTTTSNDPASLPVTKLKPHPDDTGDGPPQGPGDDTPLDRVEFEYADGRIQRLTGDAAIAWMKDINGPIIAQALRYSQDQIRSDHPWQWSRRNDETPPVGWQRVQRRIYSPFWRAMHNLVAHPWLVICRPIGEFLHEFTAERMYTPKGDKPPIVSDAD
jgi:hypothetical protein